MVLRYVYLLRGSWPRILELAYWPTVQMILWGFISQFFLTHSSWVAQAAGVLIAAVLLWDVLFRGQLGVSIPFLEEMWSRNLANLFISPLRPYELILALLGMSFIRTFVGVVPAAFLAIALYQYSVFDLGLPLLSFFVNLLVMGWSIGLVVSALILRYGLGAESLAWIAIFAVAPVSAIYYPVAVLPEWLQVVSWALPSAYVFEGMRAVMFEGVFRTDYLLRAVLLNILYLGLGSAFFLYVFRLARRDGLLLKMGE
ncbi:MAG: ABC transporter permease [Proteobacteria bacterium]|nr:ABC transporter permease [Pseudomonadota bacterium]